MTAPLLVADIGGTNARFALSLPDTASGQPQIEQIRHFSVSEYPELGGAIAAYLQSITGEQPEQACLAVAAPILHGIADFTNSPWVVEAASLAERFDFAAVRLVNDLQALARGAPMLDPASLDVLIPGDPEPGRSQVVVGPGTGLGQALLVPDGTRWIVLATEGGHTAFAPQDPEEAEILGWLAGRFGYVSFERVVSGQGIENLYQALSAVRGIASSALTAREISDASATDRQARDALGYFSAITGTFAGNAALAAGARGGVYLGGGILPKLGPRFDRARFTRRFKERGPMSPFLEGVPVRLILSDLAAFLGAAALWTELG